MSVEYRPLGPEDVEQAAYLEATAFYDQPTAERTELMRQVIPPDWTLGAFVSGRLVADARVLPTARRINGGQLPFGCVGPVACLAEHRRQGYVGRLMRMWLERMREQGTALSGLHTPHDSLYQRFGWERAEGRKRYTFRAKDVMIRVRGAAGAMVPVDADGWQRLDNIYRRYAEPRNGPLERPEPWWRHGIFRHYESGRRQRAFVWSAASGDDQGYIVYASQPLGWDPDRGGGHALVVRDMVSLTADAYLGLWQHLLGHDLARPIAVEVPLDDPFWQLVQDPWNVNVLRAEGAMIRVVDVERALAARPYVGERPLAFTMRVVDHSAAWNDGVWRVEAADGRMTAERASGEADLELSVNFLAPLFTGFIRPDRAAASGMLKVNRPAALDQATAAFAVTHPPFCNDLY